MAQGGRFPRRTATGAALFMLTAGLVFALGAAWPAAAATSVISVTGSAFGSEAINVSLLGGTPQNQAPTPTVTLASDASNSPQSASAPNGHITFGPATLFSSDAITVQASGSVGASGSESSSSSITNINKSTTQPTITGSEVLTADLLTGSCSASPAGNSGSTGITNGTLQTDDSTSPPTVQTLPASPAPNTAITGVLHPFSGQTDHFVYVFNEQVTNADGSLTVNPVHEYLGYQLVNGQLVADPTYPAPGSSAAQGQIILGQVVCGVTVGTDVVLQSISPSSNPVAPTNPVTFTITISNNGTSPATSVVDATTFHGGKFAAVTASQGTCVAPKGRKPAICSLGTLAGGQSATVQLTLTAPHKAGGTITVTSSVSSPVDTDTSNNTMSSSVQVQ